MRSKLILSMAVLGVLSVGLPRAVLTFAAEPATTKPAGAIHIDHPALSKLGWQLAAQSGTFGDKSLFETIDLFHAQVVHHIELEPGQALSPAQPDVKVGPDMAAADSDALVAKLKTVKMDIVSIGVMQMTNDEANARKVFDLGKKLKVKVIVVSAPADALPLLDKLATEYAVNVAMVNVASPGEPSTVDALLAAMQGRSKRIGVAADIANFRKSGLDPVDCVTKLNGHLMEVRLGDVDADNNEVPLGMGTANIAGVLKEIKAQNFKSIVAAGYHTGGGADLTNNFYTSVNAMAAETTKLAATP